MLVAQAASFVPELLAKMWRDVRTLWEWDGREATAGSAARDMLNRCVVTSPRSANSAAGRR